MLRLRKALLCDWLYILILFLVLIITIIRLNIPNKSNLTAKTNTFTGIVTKIEKTDDKTKLYIENNETIIGTIYKNNLNINLGDKIKVFGEFLKPSSNTTKYLYNYKEYLERKNIFYLVNIKSIKLIKSNSNIYCYLKQKLINHLGNSPYLYTFLLGDKYLLKEEVKRSYQENGISHLFAISGMHITLLVNIIKKLLKKIKLREEKVFLITNIVLVIYLFIVGLSPSILRGVLFYFLFNFNNIYYFYIKKINLFILIISISLLINPNYVFDVGFQYSYSISFALLMFSKYLTSKNYLISLLKVSFISFLVSIPITLYNYYQINLLSIIYNLIFVPFVSIIIFPFTLIVLLIKPLEPIYNLLIKILEELSLSINEISIGKIIFKRLPTIIYILYFLIIVFFIIKPNKKTLITIISILIIHYSIPIFDTNKYVEIIDVGQGDSTLIHLNNKNILIDTGGVKDTNYIFYNTLYPIFKSSGIKKIDYLILTHGDFDHMGEAINLVNNFKVDKVIFNCGEFNDLEKGLIKVLDNKKIEYYSCIKELNIDDNKLYFLQTKEYYNENDNSNVIYTELNNNKFMFMGDAGIEKEKDILKKYNISSIDVLKVGHHGSKTSSGKEFINEVNPRYSIISVGKNNRYGHPNKEAIDNLKNSKMYRTDQNGSIMFKVKNNKLRIETCSP